jgi:hypothetical protein
MILFCCMSYQNVRMKQGMLTIKSQGERSRTMTLFLSEPLQGGMGGVSSVTLARTAIFLLDLF